MNLKILKIILCILSIGFTFGIYIPKALTCESFFITGYLDKRVVQKNVRKHEPEIRHCYETALLKNKTLEGNIMTSFTILANGSVEKAKITHSTLNNPELEQCIIDRIENWQFPSVNTDGDDSKTLVEYPFVFVSNYKPPKILEHIRVILNEDDMIIEDVEMPPSTPADE